MQLKLSCSWLTYKVIFHTLKSKSQKIVLNNLRFYSQNNPFNHRIYTNGFLFEEKFYERNLNKSKIKEYKLKTDDIKKIKNVGDFFLRMEKNRKFFFESSKEV